MIVKDEEHTIVSLLESVRNHIVGYVVCDTGSSDQTIMIVEKWSRDAGLPGVLLQHSWRDFSYNRNQCLQYGQNIMKSKCAYWLILDADEVFVVGGKYNTNLSEISFNQDAYLLKEVAHGLEFYNLKLLRASLNWFFEGVVHEAVKLKHSYTRGNLPEYIYARHDAINERGFEHDIKLMKQELESNPNDARLIFLIAKAQHVINATAAVPRYIERIYLGESPGLEEVFWSKYSLARIVEDAYGEMREEKGLLDTLRNSGLIKGERVQFEEVVKAYNIAASDRPYRYEPWFRIAHLFWLQKADAASCYKYSKRGLRAGPVMPYTLFSQNLTVYYLHYLSCVCGSIVAHQEKTPLESCQKIITDISKLSTLSNDEKAILDAATEVSAHFQNTHPKLDESKSKGVSPVQ